MIELFNRSELLLLALLAELDDVDAFPSDGFLLLEGVIFLINLAANLFSFTLVLLALGRVPLVWTGVLYFLSGGAGERLFPFTGVGLASVFLVAQCIGCSVNGASSSGALHQLGCPYSELPLLLDTKQNNP